MSEREHASLYAYLSYRDAPATLALVLTGGAPICSATTRVIINVPLLDNIYGL
jgi:hypothetical protein